MSARHSLLQGPCQTLTRLLSERDCIDMKRVTFISKLLNRAGETVAPSAGM